MRTFIVKVETPYLYSDNPQVRFYSKDGLFDQTVPMNQHVKKLLGVRKEAYFQITLDSLKIISMIPVKDQKWEKEN